jgi:hypothetical protein
MSGTMGMASMERVALPHASPSSAGAHVLFNGILSPYNLRLVQQFTGHSQVEEHGVLNIGGLSGFAD